MSEFLYRPIRLNMYVREPYFVADYEGRIRQSMLICLFFVSFLGNGYHRLNLLIDGGNLQSHIFGRRNRFFLGNAYRNIRCLPYQISKSESSVVDDLLLL